MIFTQIALLIMFLLGFATGRWSNKNDCHGCSNWIMKKEEPKGEDNTLEILQRQNMDNEKEKSKEEENAHGFHK